MRKCLVLMLGVVLLAGIFSGIVVAISNDNDDLSIQSGETTYYIYGYKFWHSEQEKLNGWTIYLEKWNEDLEKWELIDSTVTETYKSEDGVYLFKDLEAGKYRITEEVKPGWYLVRTWPETVDGAHIVELNHPSVGPYSFCNDKLPSTDPLTPGYWKTHSRYGPAPYDHTWATVGEDTIFFLSDQTYYEVLWTEPAGGNAYYILAHAYIAARLNINNGVIMPAEVQSAFDAATILFNTYTPSDVGSWRGSQGARSDFISLAEILDDFNNGREISTMTETTVADEPAPAAAGSEEGDSEKRWFEDIGSKDNDNQAPGWVEDVVNNDMGNSGKRWFE